MKEAQINTIVMRTKDPFIQLIFLDTFEYSTQPNVMQISRDRHRFVFFFFCDIGLLRP